MIRMVVLIGLAACGDNLPGKAVDASVVFDTAIDASLAGDLFGEACTQPPFPQIGVCHDGQGGCTDETGGSVCRPFCHVNGVPQCAARDGNEVITDRGACVCVPK